MAGGKGREGKGGDGKGREGRGWGLVVGLPGGLSGFPNVLLQLLVAFKCISAKKTHAMKPDMDRLNFLNEFFINR